MDGARAALPAGSVTFLFTDIAGSTRMFRAIGERYKSVLGRHNELLRAAFRAHGGVEIKTEGDAFFCAFSDARSALLACVDGQRALTAEPWDDDAVVTVRMGAHTGEAEPVGGDYIALAVHQAARIAAVAHGGQVIASDATLRAAGELPETIVVKDLGPNLLKDFPDAVRIWQLHSDRLRSDFPPLRTRIVSLPTPRTTFIGRGEDLDNVVSSIAVPGLTTLVGPGGVGKTRLAIEAATAIAAKQETGVHFAEFGSEGGEAAITATLMRQVGVGDQPGVVPIDTLASEIGARRTIVVLDNCEQVVDDVATVVDTLLSRCPNLSVLATSRVPLEIDGEQRLPIHPLPVESDDERTGDAVRLFLDRVAMASGATAFSVEDIEAAAEVCRRLDGLPLALELAASTVSTIPLPVLVNELDSRLDLLRSRGRSPRQRTLRALLDWSFELLSDHARIALRRLAPVAGSFGVDAATAAITCIPDVPPNATVRILAELAAHSFLAVDSTGAHYTLLETIRVYAADHLDAAGERPTVRDALCAYVREWAALVYVDGRDAAARIRDVKTSYPLVAMALETFEQEQDAESMAAICAGLGRYWFIRGENREGHAWCRRALALPGENSRSRIATMAYMGRLCPSIDDVPECVAVLRAAQHLAREFDEMSLAMYCVMYEASVAQWDGSLFQQMSAADRDASEHAFRELIEFAERTGDAHLAAIANNHQGITAFFLDQFETARDFYQDALRAAAGSDFIRENPVFHLNLGEVLGILGDIDLAVTHLRIAVDEGRELEYTAPHAVGLHLLLQYETDPERRSSYAAELRRLRSRIGPELDDAVAIAGGYDISQSDRASAPSTA